MWRSVFAAATLLIGAGGLNTQGRDAVDSPAWERPTRQFVSPSDCLTTCTVETMMDLTACECHGDSSGLVEMNTIPYDPATNNLRPHYLSWYPTEVPAEKRSCYMKVRVTGTNHENLRARVVSSVGVHHANPGRDYGRREDDVGPAGAATKAVCIEYKCSGYVWTTINDRPYHGPSDIDYTLVKLSFLRSDGSAASCSRVATTPLFAFIDEQITSPALAQYSVSPPDNSDQSRFLFYDSPNDLGLGFGIYKATGANEVGKQTAYQRCLAGTSSGTGATTIDPDANWLVHFICNGDPVSGLVEMNTIPYDPATNNLRPHYLSWYPTEVPAEKRSCYMKVRVTGTNHENLRARVVSSVGVHPANLGSDYGRREDDVEPAGAATKAVCIEYKCSGDVWTTRNNRPYRDPSSDVDYTLVNLSFLRNDGSAASCNRVEVTPTFQTIDQITLMTLQSTYSVSPPDNSDQSRFQFYDSPNDLGLSFGIYKATGANDAGKQAAYQRCLAGTSSGTGAHTIDPDANWLVHFDCN
ncbi:cartilage intermediate layer protein 2-like [Branchiostoma floridae x Branchiostoma japonicum]